MTLQKKHMQGIALATVLLTGFEGIRERAYLDPVGIPTVCMGETRGVKIGDTYTLAQCQAMANARVAEFAKGVDAALTVEVSDRTYASFVSWSYNLGLKSFDTNIAPLVNAGRIADACRRMGLYVYAHGIRLPGLVARRKEEVALCLAGLQ